MLRRTTLIAVLTCLVSSVEPAAAGPKKPLPGKWLEITTPHFVVVTNASPKSARETAEHFERIRALFTLPLPQITSGKGLPLKVFAADGEKTMKRLLPGHFEGNSQPAGTFQRTSTTTQVTVRADLVRNGDLRIVYHEYFHFLVDRVGPRPPVWLNEGLAEYWGNTRLTPDAAEVGLPNAAYIAILRDRKLLPIELLVSVDHSSEYYRERRKQELFYAQSWALVHYLLLGDKSGEGRRQFFEYLRYLDGGAESRDAAVQAFGDLEKLRKRLSSYARKASFHYVTMRQPEAPAADHFASRELPLAEAAALVADFVLAAGPSKGAEDLVALALKDAPELAMTHQAAGLYHRRRGEHLESANAFEKAIALEGAGAVSHYGLAVLGLYEDRSPAALEAAEQHLLQAISIDPNFAPALARLAEVYRRLDDAPGRALAMIRRALARRPEHNFYRLKAAQILFESGQEAAAKTAIAEVMSEALATDSATFSNNLCWYGSFWGLATVVMPLCDHAVAQDPEDHPSLDSRGVARALAGDVAGALVDLRAARRLAGDDWSPETQAKRDLWIHSLESGVSPFVGEGLKQLRDDTEETGLGWGR